jgi:hypothetical protein
VWIRDTLIVGSFNMSQLKLMHRKNYLSSHFSVRRIKEYLKDFTCILQSPTSVTFQWSDPTRAQHDFTWPESIRPDPRSKIIFGKSKLVLAKIKSRFWWIYTSSFNIQSNEIIISSRIAVCLMQNPKSLNILWLDQIRVEHWSILFFLN